VDPHQLRTFVTVVRLRSFSAAAAELGYTQAAVSQQIAALESDLKVVLLNRRPVTPTEPGTRLLEHADPILLRLDAARADIARMVSAPAASLVLGLTPLAGASPAVAQALAALRQQMPRVAVAIQAGSQRDVAFRVARGDCDLGLIDGLATAGDSLRVQEPLSGVGIAESEAALVLPPDHPLAGRPGIRLVDLVDARWIEAPDVAPPLSDIRRLAGAEGFRAALRYEGPDTLSLIALATAGHGLTVLPTWLAPTSEFASVRVTGERRIVHRVELVHGVLRDGSPAAKLANLLR
jgi:DNA-binding transcriptional LysR family regulator